MSILIELACDGSGNRGDTPYGWAFVLRAVNTVTGEVVKEVEGGGHGPEGTNNVAELSALLGGLRALTRPARVTAYLDSEYVLKAFRDDWVGKWQRNGWRTSAKRADGSRDVKNRALWEALIPEVAKHEITWEWVRGHDGHPLNERADELAGMQRLLAVERVRDDTEPYDPAERVMGVDPDPAEVAPTPRMESGQLALAGMVPRAKLMDVEWP